MKISRKAEYALRAAVAIARADPGRPVPIQELSAAEAIPQKFLEQIVLSLRHAGLLQSRRGAGGGYLLAREPHRISVLDVLKAIEGEFPHATTLDHPNSGLARTLREASDLAAAALAEKSLRDVIELDRESGAMAFEI